MSSRWTYTITNMCAQGLEQSFLFIYLCFNLISHFDSFGSYLYHRESHINTQRQTHSHRAVTFFLHLLLKPFMAPSPTDSHTNCDLLGGGDRDRPHLRIQQPGLSPLLTQRSPSSLSHRRLLQWYTIDLFHRMTETERAMLEEGQRDIEPGKRDKVENIINVTELFAVVNVSSAQLVEWQCVDSKYTLWEEMIVRKLFKGCYRL